MAYVTREKRSNTTIGGHAPLGGHDRACPTEMECMNGGIGVPSSCVSKQLKRFIASTMFASLLLVLTVTAVIAQTSSSSIAGNVVDSFGARVSGATVTATQTEQSVSLTATSDAHGHYTFPDVIPGTYTLTIEAKGFKKQVQTSLVVEANAAVNAGDSKLVVGGVNETVTVSDSGQHLQLQTVERADNISHKELLDLPIDAGSNSGRSYLGALAVVTGEQTFEASSLSSNINGAQYHQNNLTLDGILNVDAGGNGGQLVDLNADNVGEMHVSTHDGGAEYGREQNTIAVTTPSGTSEFHGEFAWFHRHEDLNANSWANERTPTLTPISKSRLNEFSGNFGGPVKLPHVKKSLAHELFFYVGEDVQHPLLAEGNRYVNLPTYAESQGDFSQSHTEKGDPFYLTDYTASGTGVCTSANTVQNPGRCFVGLSTITGQPALNVISGSKQSALGATILGIYKNYIPSAGYLGYPSAGIYGARGQEQIDAPSYNYSNDLSDTEQYRQDLYRIDFNPGHSWQTHIRWINLVENLSTYYGARYSDQTNMPTTLFNFDTPGHGIAAGITKIFNSTTTNELTGGFNVGKIDGAPVTDALTKTALGIENIPLQFASSVQDQIPDLEFRGSNLTNSPTLIANDAPYRNANTAIDLLDNFTKVIGVHEIQVGVQFERLRKDQYNAGTPGGLYQFGDDVNNPLDTSDAYANALTGVFDTMSQQSGWLDGKYRYGALDSYGQDTWRANKQLTIVAGIRFQYWTPFYDSSGHSLNFNPLLWIAQASPRLYYPEGSGSTDLGVSGSLFPKAYATLIVPGSGNNDNGMVAQAGAKFTNNLGGIIPTTSKYLFNAPKFLTSPHLGFTLDVFGNQATVFRMGVGAYYDRYSGNTVFNMINNPPSISDPTIYYGTFNSLNSSSGLVGPSNINSVENGMKYPITWQFNSDIQQALAYHTVLDIAYVGSSSSHLEQPQNLNWIPYGTTFQSQNQNPAGTSKVPGANAYAQPLLEPYRGYSSINYYESGASSNFNSLQTTVSRAYADGIFVKIAYIYGKTLGTSSTEFGGVDHLGRTRELFYAPTNFDRRNMFTATYIYAIPRLFKGSLLHSFIDGWQVSGNTTLWSGNPFTVNQTVYYPGTTTALTSAELTGSYTEGARVQLIGNPFAGVAKSGPYNRLNPTAFKASPAGSLSDPLGYTGLGMRPNQFYGPGIDNTDMALEKDFSLDSNRVNVQLRADAFNVFNHVSFTGYNTTVTFPNGPGTVGTPGGPVSIGQSPNQTVTFANGSSPTNTGGFGGVSGAEPNRVVALMARIRF